MNDTSQSSHPYVLGHSDEELRRLQKQAELWHPAAHRFLEEVGIKAGMKVLDVGTGAGDIALLLTERVGPDGQVIGVDSNPTVLDVARRRAEAAAFTNVSFVQADITQMEVARDFDAIMGRCILPHLREPVAVLGRLVRSLRPEGRIGFQEYDFTRVSNSLPRCALYDQAYSWIRETLRHAGLDFQVGMRLYSLFLDAGLPAPQMYSEAVVGAGPNWGGYEVTALTIRTLLPLILKFGIATKQEVDIDTLTSRLQEGIVSQRGVARGPDIISA
ncbi:MAG: class I SAM-dependent methyltransferase [Ktedonobacteraceae bacterium]